MIFLVELPDFFDRDLMISPVGMHNSAEPTRAYESFLDQVSMKGLEEDLRRKRLILFRHDLRGRPYNALLVENYTSSESVVARSRLLADEFKERFRLDQARRELSFSLLEVFHR